MELAAFKVILGSFGVLVAKSPAIRNAVRIAKHIKICDSGLSVKHIWDTFIPFSVIFRSFGALS